MELEGDRKAPLRECPAALEDGRKCCGVMVAEGLPKTREDRHYGQ